MPAQYKRLGFVLGNLTWKMVQRRSKDIYSVVFPRDESFFGTFNEEVRLTPDRDRSNFLFLEVLIKP